MQKMPVNNGGRPTKLDLPYSPPQGPTNQYHNAPGLGGDTHGMARQPTPSGGESGSPGIGGTNHGNNPSRNR